MAPQQGIFSDYGHEQCRAWRDDTATALQVSTEPAPQQCLISLYGNHYAHELFSACKECATTPLEVPKITASALQHWIFSDYGSYKGHALCRHWREHTTGCRSMKFRLRLRVSNADYLACKAGIMSMHYWVPGGKIRLFARLLTTLLSYRSSTHSNLLTGNFCICQLGWCEKTCNQCIPYWECPNQSIRYHPFITLAKELGGWVQKMISFGAITLIKIF